jgi:two-component sensor histidine kinase
LRKVNRLAFACGTLASIAIGDRESFAGRHIVEVAISNRLDGGTREAPRQRADFAASGGDAVVDLTPDGKITHWNAAAGQLFDLEAMNACGSPISSRKLRLAAVGINRLLANAIRSGNLSSGGIDLSISISPILDGRGLVTGASLVTRDISDRVREQRRRALVVQELNHRIRNTFAIVQATARQVFKDWKNPDSPSAQFLEKLNALARSRGLLDTSSWRGLSLRDIAVEQVGPYAGDDMRRCTCDGPNIVVQPEAATALGMAFRELATNSAKDGAFSSATGRVQLSWTIEGEGASRHLALCWREFGGPAVKAPRRRGLGSRMLEQGIAIELGGRAELRFHPAGVWYSLTAPLASIESR